MKPFGILTSDILWAMAALPLIALLLSRLEKIIRNLHQEIGRPVTAGRLKRLLLPLGLCALALFAISRPYYGENRVTVHGSGRDIVVLLDISLSMLAQDASPSRLEFARRKVLDIIRYTQLNSPEDRIGLILFAGDAYMYCPLTSDLGIVTEFLQNAGPDLITSRGSSLLRAIEVAREALKHTRSLRSRLVILSDGEDLESDERTIGQTLQRVPGSALFLGIGSLEGSPIPLPQGGFLASSGETVVTRLREDDIQRLFTTPKAQYRRATVTDGDFAPFLQRSAEDLFTSEGNSTTREIITYGEAGPFILTGILLLVALLSLRGAERTILLAFILFIPTFAHAQEALNDSPAYLGYQRYQAGDFEGAYDHFMEARKATPDDPKILQSLGSAAFKLGRFDEAESHFRAASKSALSDSRRFESLYDLGNAELAQKKYKDAIDSYSSALKLREKDEMTLHNKAIAEKLLQQEEEKKKQEKSESSSSSSSSSSQSSGEKSSEQESSQGSSESSASSPGSSSSESSTGQSDKSQSSPAGSSQSSDEKSAGSASSSSESGNQEQSSSQASRQKESEGTPSPSKPAPAGQPTPTDATPLSEREAEAWLRALPESPLLIQRLNKQERKNAGEQLW